MRFRIRISLFFGLLLGLFQTPVATAQNRPVDLPPLDSLSLSDMQSTFSGLLITATTLDSILRIKSSETDSLQALASQQWMAVKGDSTVAKSVQDSLGKIARQAKEASKKANGQQSKASKLLQMLASVPMDDSLSLRKNLPKAWKQTRQLYDDLYPPPPLAPPADVAPDTLSNIKAENTVKADKAPAPASTPLVRQTARYNPANDVMLHPPVPPCVVASTVRDEFSGEITREMSRSEWFRYTNPALRNYLQGKTHVICEAALRSSGPNMALLLTFTIQDPNARKAFGRLEQNSIAQLKFLDGSMFVLQNAVPDDGIYNPETEIMTYRAEYPLNAEVVKKLRNEESDKIRIAWSKGYEDYDIQQVDLLMRQAACVFGK
ncbi:MAG TPA: hypothetical protein VK168_07990 [Saprospiraceae bacterium]|nr:hypothetical protein [Saprospiraceae bacterium]